MSQSLADTVVTLLAAYAAAGVVVALAFQARGIARVDAAARRAPLGFRLLIMPGLAALWPWVLLAWRKAARPGKEPSA